jgi:hypothetical protein
MLGHLGTEPQLTICPGRQDGDLGSFGRRALRENIMVDDTEQDPVGTASGNHCWQHRESTWHLQCNDILADKSGGVEQRTAGERIGVIGDEFGIRPLDHHDRRVVECRNDTDRRVG